MIHESLKDTTGPLFDRFDAVATYLVRCLGFDIEQIHIECTGHVWRHGTNGNVIALTYRGATVFDCFIHWSGGRMLVTQTWEDRPEK